jgi:hypothetical protein
MSSNIFNDVLNDASKVEEELLGPSYNYSAQIKMPEDMGMSDKGDLSTLAKDITGLTEYVKALVSGNSKATKAKYLGNKFFLKTGAKCKSKDTQDEVDRYVYINNVPSGNIPFISGAMGVNFKEFKGLIPGVMSELNNFNPFTILSSFMSGSEPECQEITLQVIDNSNNKTNETHYVTTTDLNNMDPCNFNDGKNPINNKKCVQAFTTLNDYSDFDNFSLNNDDDIYCCLYLLGLGFLLIYIIYKLLLKKF